MGELLCPCLVQGSVGVVYPVRPQEEQPQWRGSSGNLDSAPAGTPSAGPGGSGAGPLICSARGRSVLAVLGPPGLCLSRGEAGSWAVSRRPVLRSLRWWIRAPGPRNPLRGAAARAPPSCSWNRAAPSARSLFLCPSPSELLPGPRSPLRAAPSAEPPPEPPELLRVPPCALQPLGSSAHSPGAQVSVSVPGSPRASPPSWVLLHLPASPFPPGKVGAAPAPPGRGSPVLGTLAPASARLLAGPLPLGGLCFFISFSPSSYLDRSANSSHCSIPAGLSLNLRPNS